MAITFTCPHCHEVTLIGDEFAGQSGECRACGQVVTVPRQGEKPPPIIILDESPARVRRKSSGLLWKTGIVLAGLFLVFLALMAPLLNYLRTEARRMSSGNNLKQIALAMHNYQSSYKQLPRPYWLNAKGERTLSWRVTLMPFLESSPFYDIYQKDEAWNSPANQESRETIVPVYKGPWNHDQNSRETAYLVITGPGTLFEEGKDLGMDDCVDGTSNTILAVEVKHSGIEWTEPRDLDIRTMIMQINASDSNGISGPWKEGAQVAMVDGSVRMLSKDLLESTLRAMITRNGGEAIESSE